MMGWGMSGGLAAISKVSQFLFLMQNPQAFLWITSSQLDQVEVRYCYKKTSVTECMYVRTYYGELMQVTQEHPSFPASL